MEDLSQFKQTYFDECAELLAVAESGLLRMAPGSIDLDEVNAVFRAVHSIKGGAGAFGFTDLVAFAHEFEAVMDGVRSQTIAVSTGLVDALIRANDVLAQLVGHAREGTSPPIEPAAAAVIALRANSGLGEANGSTQGTGAPAPPPSVPAAVATALPPGARCWRIQFRPKAELLLSGNEPAFMFRALARLGDATVECHPDGLPALSMLEPELIHLHWTIRLITTAAQPEIEDVFEFVNDEGTVEITADPPPKAVARDVSAAAETSLAIAVDPALPPVGTAPSQLTVYGRNEAPGPQTKPAQKTSGEGGAAQVNLGGHTIRVDLDKIDRLVNMVGEMVITQAMIAEHLRDLPPGEFQELQEGLEQLAQHTRELRESVMSIRAQPVGSVFQRMPRLVRELAAETGKDVALETSGEATEVDKTVVENLVDPLTHMIRNSIDHGLERPDARIAAGKPPTGTVRLSAQHRSGRIVIEVADDGRGIDRPRVLRKAVERGLITEGASLSDDEIDNLIFLPGFSTVETVTNISGRGVGMDVVRRNISSLGGRIGVYSTPGEGSRFVLSLPLTLAVLDGMVISVGAERFVLPLTNIVESLRPKTADLHGLVNMCDVIMARGEYVRLVYLTRLFGIPGGVEDATKGLVVLVETEDGGRLGLVVDEVLGQQQVVIKSMETNYRRLDGVAAATILGDGRVALILDVAGLQDMSRHAAAAVSARRRQDATLSSQAVAAE